jgi:NDP-sugar pyrophosphorylase family protein
MVEGYHGSMEMEAVVLAGGFGSRMGELTKENQKCLLPIDGEPTLLHIMRRLVTAFGSVDVKIAVAYQAEKVIEAVTKYKPANVHTTFVPHEPGVESEGVYKTIRPHTNGGVFICLPGDVITHPSLYTQLVEEYDRTKYPIVFSGATDTDEVKSHGLLTIKNGQVIKIVPPPMTRDAEEGEVRDLTTFATDSRMYAMADKYPAIKKMFSSSVMQAHTAGETIGGIIYERPWIHLADASDLQKSARERRI